MIFTLLWWLWLCYIMYVVFHHPSTPPPLPSLKLYKRTFNDCGFRHLMLWIQGWYCQIWWWVFSPPFISHLINTRHRLMVYYIRAGHGKPIDHTGPMWPLFYPTPRSSMDSLILCSSSETIIFFNETTREAIHRKRLASIWEDLTPQQGESRRNIPKARKD